MYPVAMSMSIAISPNDVCAFNAPFKFSCRSYIVFVLLSHKAIHTMFANMLVVANFQTLLRHREFQSTFKGKLL